MNRRNRDMGDGYQDRDNNFDRMFDARQYRDERDYQDYDDYRDNGRDSYQREPSIRRNDRPYRDNNRNNRNEYDNYDREPRKRSFFRNNISRKRDRNEDVDMQNAGVSSPNQCVVMTPKSFEDIQGIIDNLKANRPLIVDLSRLNDNSVQRVMDYLNGAVYALDGSIQRISPAVFLLTPTGMGISVPIDYIKDKWERNKRR